MTTDPDIMIHEVKNYKMRIPPYVEVFHCNEYKL